MKSLNNIPHPFPNEKSTDLGKREGGGTRMWRLNLYPLQVPSSLNMVGFCQGLCSALNMGFVQVIEAKSLYCDEEMRKIRFHEVSLKIPLDHSHVHHIHTFNILLG